MQSLDVLRYTASARARGRTRAMPSCCLMRKIVTRDHLPPSSPEAAATGADLQAAEDAPQPLVEAPGGPASLG